MYPVLPNKSGFGTSNLSFWFQPNFGSKIRSVVMTAQPGRHDFESISENSARISIAPCSTENPCVGHTVPKVKK